MDFGSWFIALVVPVVVGGAALWFVGRRPALGARPALTSLGLLLLLLVLNALDTPGADLVAPTIGGIVSVVVSGAVYVALRSRSMRRSAGFRTSGR
jgi:hypothetical protein